MTKEWEFVESIVGAVFGAVVGFLTLLGFVGKRQRELRQDVSIQHKDIQDRINTAHSRIDTVGQEIHAHSTQLATLTAHHEANEKFQSRVESVLATLQEQNTEQLRLLAQLENGSSR